MDQCDKKSQKPSKKIIVTNRYLDFINPQAAGIDIGSTSHFVAVPEGCDKETVREFKSFTSDLYAMADWLKACGIKTVAMESTGVYWIPVFEVLEKSGFNVNLVDARQLKNVSGRKTDIVDCQWIQQMHTCGLLKAAFRPADEICELRAYVRQRAMLIQSMSSHILHMQKSLTQMNIQVHHVLTDITGDTGMKIIRSIVAGERDPKVLAQHRDRRCHQSVETIEKALMGNYRAEHLFALKQTLELYDFYQEKIIACDQAIEQKLLQFNDHSDHDNSDVKKSSKKSHYHTKHKMSFDLEGYLLRITGINLVEIPGINTLTALSMIGEIGLDMTRWKTGKHFASWLGLSPNNKISGGKRLSSKTKPSANRAATALRIAASSLHRSPTALGAFLRRLKARVGPAKAITATAHKLAKIIYNMLRYGAEYKDIGQEYYDKQYRNRVIKGLKKRAEVLGFDLISKIEMATV